ncbi:hypothetical protein [Novosphingobium sp. JCM 18896]|uniref:hypothetical protein n=1 Tax=Novosphingobium sp. JCM 18896 TaxID=2989731 RepID=UPI0022213C86|nr:hypothetical protein [Novosphingobium sp. JCM 18896]MCW1431411.1 hypothetical protein [Novosphingobium sp. JCM 18896]
MKGLTEALKGISGDYELNRLVGFFGGIVYVIGAHIFVGYEVLWLGKPFDLTAYCLAFPGGLAVVAGGTAAAVAIKDRNVAASKVIEQTGSNPATPPAPAPPVQPELAVVPDDTLPEYAR